MVEVRLFDIDIEIAIGNTVKVPVFGTKIYLARYELDTRGCQAEQDTIDANMAQTKAHLPLTTSEELRQHHITWGAKNSQCGRPK